MKMQLKKDEINNIFNIFLIIHLIVWVAIPTLTNNNLPLDTIEALAWGSNMDWGFNKHPPVSAFLTACGGSDVIELPDTAPAVDSTSAKPESKSSINDLKADNGTLRDLLNNQGKEEIGAGVVGVGVSLFNIVLKRSNISVGSNGLVK